MEELNTVFQWLGFSNLLVTYVERWVYIRKEGEKNVQAIASTGDTNTHNTLINNLLQ